MNRVSTHPLLTDLTAGGEIFPHQYLPVHDRMLLVRLPDRAVREASFLDERVLPAGVEGAWFETAAVENALRICRTPRSGISFTPDIADRRWPRGCSALSPAQLAFVNPYRCALLRWTFPRRAAPC